ncbi:glycoprotease family-domain-containing protein [Roridomyces roridus]|uniref:N(6)-L-threonylcarbamoyladenine synthase n=1 Tax=Roridomyces roridus TaxID=1738132 RepID=A0AAD7CFK0_9AGAR|nr:glycoprotease family-domain-containing protein [Roridomyces roridus]
MHRVRLQLRHASSVAQASTRLPGPFRVLAIETSADDSAAAVVDANRKIWSSVIVKQFEYHQPHGGIQPLIALRAHQRNLPDAVRRALLDAQLSMQDIDGVAFTRGPGLPGCLGVGCNAAKTLAAATNKPLVGVHHMQGHALTALLTTETPPQFPFVTLLVSGGHTMVVLATGNSEFQVIANTVDRSVGSTIDRVAGLLQIKWSDLGPGAALEQYCAEPVEDDGPRPETPTIMPGQLAFSFAGLHSWVERFIHNAGGVENVYKRALARAFLDTAFGHVETKLKMSLRWCADNNHDIRQIVVSGGVASNMLLRARLQNALPTLEFVFPEPSLCTDNAVMIAWASMHRFLANDHDEFTIGPLPKWSIEDIRNPHEPDITEL